MRRMRLLTLTSLATFTSIVLAVAQQSTEPYTGPLSDVLTRLGISLDGWDATLLSSQAFFGLGKEIRGKEAIAFASAVPGVKPMRALHVAVRDSRSGRWNDHLVDLGDDNAHRLNLGSILELRIDPNATYVVTHENPPWNNTAVLDKDWKLIHILTGWIVGTLRSGAVVFQKGEPHFAPVHPLELGIFDPKTRDERLVYPHTPFGPVRTEFNRALAQAFGAIPEEWFRANNHPDGTDRVTENLRAVHVVRESRGETIIVNSVLDGRQFDPANRSQDRSRDVEVVAVLRHADDPNKTEYREFRADDVRQQLTIKETADLATPGMVERLFALPYP